MKFIVLTTPQLEKSALQELLEVDSSVQKIEDFPNGLILIQTGQERLSFLKELIQKDPILIKHAMPVDIEGQIGGQKESDLNTILNLVHSLNQIQQGDLFSVQCRNIDSEKEYGAKDVEVFIGRALEKTGARAEFSDRDVRVSPMQKIVSILLYKRRAYVGISTAQENLSDHCDEFRIFSRQPEHICRAEFKLREALRRFNLELKGGYAIDLGAAPGGWSFVLAENGMHVTAVDPAELSPKIQGIELIEHFKGKSEAFKTDRPCDLLVNDMNMDPEDSARVMVNFSNNLKEAGYGIMTLKLVTKNVKRLFTATSSILKEKYNILKAKQLFHNRQEFTLFLQKK